MRSAHRTRNLFVKVTAQLGVNSRLAVSHNYGHGNVQDETLGRDPGFYPLSSSGTENPETINATRLAWTTAFGEPLLQRAHPGPGGRPADLRSQLALFRRYP